MSIHRSLKYSAAGAKIRNVFKRTERLQILTENERWSAEEDSVYGLPKVRTRFKTVSRKKKKAADDDEPKT